jgi:hypothetical protein
MKKPQVNPHTLKMIDTECPENTSCVNCFKSGYCNILASFKTICDIANSDNTD